MSNARKTVGPYVVKPHEDNDLLFRIVDGANELAAIVGKMSFRLTPESCPEQFELNKASAARFAACLNVCDGISTEVLELNATAGGVATLERQRDAARQERDTWEQRACKEATRVVELEQQRDALLAALEEARAFIGEQQPRTEKVGNRVHLREDLSRVMRVMGQMDAAIESAKAGTV